MERSDWAWPQEELAGLSLQPADLKAFTGDRGLGQLCGWKQKKCTAESWQLVWQILCVCVYFTHSMLTQQKPYITFINFLIKLCSKSDFSNNLDTLCSTNKDLCCLVIVHKVKYVEKFKNVMLSWCYKNRDMSSLFLPPSLPLSSFLPSSLPSIHPSNSHEIKFTSVWTCSKFIWLI